MRIYSESKSYITGDQHNAAEIWLDSNSSGKLLLILSFYSNSLVTWSFYRQVRCIRYGKCGGNKSEMQWNKMYS